MFNSAIKQYLNPCDFSDHMIRSEPMKSSLVSDDKRDDSKKKEMMLTYQEELKEQVCHYISCHETVGETSIVDNIRIYERHGSQNTFRN